MTLLLVVASATYAALGERTSALVALGAIVPLAATGLALETRAEHALAELARLAAPTAREGDGEWTVVPAEEVVPGDLVRLQDGDIVAADARMVADGQLTVDESPLTGESQPVEKSLADDPRVFAGTTVLAGRALVRVEATGVETRYGKIGALVSVPRPARTPLERAVTRTVVRLGAIASGYVLAVAGVELLQGSGWGAALLGHITLGALVATDGLRRDPDDELDPDA